MMFLFRTFYKNIKSYSFTTATYYATMSLKMIIRCHPKISMFSASNTYFYIISLIFYF